MLGIGGGGDQMAGRPLTDSSDYKLQDKYSTFAANPLHLISYIIVPRVSSITGHHPDSSIVKLLGHFLGQLPRGVLTVHVLKLSFLSWFSL